MIFWLRLRVNFPSKKAFIDDILLTLVNKTLTKYVQPTLAKCLIATCIFDLWMSKGGHDIFVMVVNFLSTNKSWNTSLVGCLKPMICVVLPWLWSSNKSLTSFQPHKILAYIKDEGSNLPTCVQAFKSVMSCGDFGTTKPYDGSFCGHALSNVC